MCGVSVLPGMAHRCPPSAQANSEMAAMLAQVHYFHRVTGGAAAAKGLGTDGIGDRSGARSLMAGRVIRGRGLRRKLGRGR